MQGYIFLLFSSKHSPSVLEVLEVKGAFLFLADEKEMFVLVFCTFKF